MLESFYEKYGFSRRNSNNIMIHIKYYFGGYLKLVFIGLTQDFTKLVCRVNRGPPWSLNGPKDRFRLGFG
jgi:hypothetical protein